MGRTIQRLRDVRVADAGEIGGKAARLGELLAAGVRVPDGFVVRSDGVASNRDDDAALRAAVRSLGHGPFAVRSSAIGEDGAERSFAGIYESMLDVAPGDVPTAVGRVLASGGGRVQAYDGAGGARMSVIVQRMVAPRAAGVALTADPVTGDRKTCVVTAVRGLGERLVGGRTAGDEWVVRGRRATARRSPERALSEREVQRVARAARVIAVTAGSPQDVEWAIDGEGRLWIVQARAMTGLPPAVSWASPAPGAFTRQLRFGEWISEPVSPLFESWLVTVLEERLHAQLHAWTGQAAPPPHHVVVNGWYFYSLNWLSPRASIRNIPSYLSHLRREPRRVAAMFPFSVRHGIALFEQEWLTELQPRYRAGVAAAAVAVEEVPVEALPALVDDLAALAGEYFASLAALAGAAYKMEMNLGQAWRRHLAPTLGGSHLPLLAGFDVQLPGRQALASLDWWFPPIDVPASAAPAPDEHDRVVAARHDAEAAAFEALAGSPGRLASFRSLLDATQRLVPIREEQVDELTIAWPVLRRAVVRIGEALVARGTIRDADDVFFLLRNEVLDALRATTPAPPIDTDARRALRDQQARLVPPLLVGQLDPVTRFFWGAFPRLVGAKPSEHAIVNGSPASPGRATGLVRVVRGPADFDALEPGEVLVAPVTAPAWTPLFRVAVAVVTDSGSAAAHASIIAREYGIPAVVGCGDATARLRTGQRVTVDGSTGNVEPA
jgi:pyruvate,water dikinase